MKFFPEIENGVHVLYAVLAGMAGGGGLGGCGLGGCVLGGAVLVNWYETRPAHHTLEPGRSPMHFSAMLTTLGTCEGFVYWK
jgi:hypothetical protein